MIVYTLGHTETYDNYIKTDPNPRKAGRELYYPGGSIWLTFIEANKYKINKNLQDYSVYSVEITQIEDLELSKNSWYDLLITSKIIEKINNDH